MMLRPLGVVAVPRREMWEVGGGALGLSGGGWGGGGLRVDWGREKEGGGRLVRGEGSHLMLRPLGVVAVPRREMWEVGEGGEGP